ncbi:uncharacterized protein LOC124146841 [Haliotis rufescens]|uniref:uncharacterized protein LOC124146841 n=1 Tax=Haliotis rufescens TaxID=6454 RepID=UPI00201ED1EE|nr:uncharacterized protein LOC124146841 [Haliotis rufescens]
MAEETDKFTWLLVQETIRHHESAKKCQQFVQEMMWERGRVELAYINSLEKWAGALVQGVSKDGSPFQPEVQNLLVTPAREAKAQASLHQKLYNDILRADGPCLQLRKRVQDLEERIMVSDTNRVYSAAVLQFQAKVNRRQELEREVRRKKQQYEYALSASRDMNEKLDGRRRRNTPRPLSARKMETLESRQYHLQRYSDVQQSQLKEQENELRAYVKAQRESLETIQSDLNLFSHRRLCDTVELTRMFILTLAEHETSESREAKKLTLDDCRAMLSTVPETTLSDKMLSVLRERVLQVVMADGAARFTLQDLVYGLTDREGKQSTGSEGPRTRPRAPDPDTCRFRPSSPSPVCPQNINTLREDSIVGSVPETSQCGGSQIARVNHLLKIQSLQEDLVNDYLSQSAGCARPEDLVSEYLTRPTGGACQDVLTRTSPAGGACQDDWTSTRPAGGACQDDLTSTRPAGGASQDLTSTRPARGANQADLTTTHPAWNDRASEYVTETGGHDRASEYVTETGGHDRANEYVTETGGHDRASEYVTETGGHDRASEYVTETGGHDRANEYVTEVTGAPDQVVKPSPSTDTMNVFISSSNDSVLAKAGSPIPTVSKSFGSTQSLESLVLPPEKIKLPRHHLPFHVRNFCAESDDDEDDAVSSAERRLTSIGKGLRRRIFRKDEEVTLTQVIALAPGDLLRSLKDLEDVPGDLDDLSLNSSGCSNGSQSSSSCDSSSESDEVSLMTNVRVRALHAYQARSTKEISLDQGQIVKQKHGVDDQGFSFGWTRSRKLAPKRYGYYPAGMVELLPLYRKKVHRYDQPETKEPEERDHNVKPLPL